MGPDRRNAAVARALAAVLLWSTVATAFKLALRRMDPAVLLALSSAFSCLCLTCCAAVDGNLRAVWRQRWTDWLRSAGLGLLNPFLYYLVLFNAYARLPAQEAQPLNYTWPLMLAVLSVPLLGERLGPRDAAALLLSFFGVVIISTRGDVLSFAVSDPLGCALALGSSVLWALYWIGSLRDRRDRSVTLATSFLFGTLWSVLYLAVVGRGAAVPDAAGLGLAAYIGAFEMGLTFLLWLGALARAGRNARIAALAYLSPFLSLFFIRTIAGESIRASSVTGLILIVAGIAWQNVGSTQR